MLRVYNYELLMNNINVISKYTIYLYLVEFKIFEDIDRLIYHLYGICNIFNISNWGET